MVRDPDGVWPWWWRQKGRLRMELSSDCVGMLVNAWPSRWRSRPILRGEGNRMKRTLQFSSIWYVARRRKCQVRAALVRRIQIPRSAQCFVRSAHCALQFSMNATDQILRQAAFWLVEIAAFDAKTVEMGINNDDQGFVAGITRPGWPPPAARPLGKKRYHPGTSFLSHYNQDF